jgi:cytochrome c-type biogenesis protein CcmH/NrfG
MRSDSIAFGIAGILFGLLAGWVIGGQQARMGPQVPATPPAAQVAAPAGNSTPPPLDETRVAAFKSVAEREPNNPAPRVQLGNLYFDAEKFDEAMRWYSEGLKLAPRNADVSTDLALCYFYTNQSDKALEQFKTSLAIDPKHVKTLLNLGLVRAYGKQDLAGAQVAWQQVLDIAPDSPEGRKAKQALDSIKSSHPNVGVAAPPGS